MSEQGEEEIKVDGVKGNTDIREYGEELDVSIIKEKGRWVILAFNQAGYDSTSVDLLDVLEWVKNNKEKIR